MKAVDKFLSEGFTSEQIQEAQETAKRGRLRKWLTDTYGTLLVLLVRSDLGMRSGKISAQVGHAAIGAVEESDPVNVQLWKQQSRRILIFKVDEQTISDIVPRADASGIVTYTIQDEGRTQIEAGSETVTSLGPDLAYKLLPFTTELKPL